MKIRTILLALTCAVCAVRVSPASAAETEAASPSAAVPVPLSGTHIDSVLVSVNGEPITLLDVILETGSREKELAGIYSGERLLTETRKLRMETVEQIVFRKLIYEK